MIGRQIGGRIATAQTRPAAAALLRAPWATIAVAVIAAAAIGYKPILSLWFAGSPWVPPQYQSVALSLSDAGLVAIVVLGLLTARGRERAAAGVATWAFGGAALVLVGCLLLSATAAPLPSLSLLCAARAGAGALGALTIARRPDFARAVLLGGALLLFAELPIAVAQIATQSTFPTGRLLDGWPGEIGAAATGAAVVIGPGGARWQRALGTFPHPNILGAFAALVVVCALPWLARGGRAGAAVLAAWAAGWLALLLSFSRAAWLAAALGCALWGLGRARRLDRRRLLRFAVPPLVALALCLPVAGAALWSRLLPTPALLASPAATDRLLLGDIALTMIAGHPLRGVGAGNFAIAELLPPFLAIAVEPVHDVPLLVAAEAGIVAGLAWLALLVAPALAGWRRGRGGPARLALPAAILALGAFDHFFWTFAAGQALFWLAVGVWLAGWPAFPGQRQCAPVSPVPALAPSPVAPEG